MESSSKKSVNMGTVVQKTMFFTLTNVVSFLALFLTDLILLQTLTGDNYANYIVFKKLSELFRIVVVFEIINGIIKFWRENQGTFNLKLIKSALLINIILYCIGVVIIILTMYLTLSDEPTMAPNLPILLSLMLVTVFADLFYRFFTAILFSYKAHFKNSLLNLINGFSFLIFVIIGIRFLGPTDLTAMVGYMVMYLASLVFAGILSVIEFRKHHTFHPVSEEGISDANRIDQANVTGDEGENPSQGKSGQLRLRLVLFCLPLFGVQLFSFFFLNVNELFLYRVDKLLVVYYTWPKDFIINVISFLGMTIAISLFPFISSAINEQRTEEVHEIVKLTKNLYILFILPLLLIIAILPREIFTLLRLQYQDDLWLFISFKQLILAGFFYSTYQLLHRYIIAAGRTRFILFAQICSATLNLVLVISLITRYPLYAAIWGLNLSLILLTALYLWKFHKEFHETHFVQNVIKIIAIFVAVSLVDWGLEKIISINYFTLIIILGLYIGLILGLRITNIPEIKTFLNYLLNFKDLRGKLRSLRGKKDK